MRTKALPPEQRSEVRGGRFFPALCNIIGTIILLAVIITCLPLTVPKLFGYDIYCVVSPSMAPGIPTGSVVYVKEAEASQVQAGDIIAFYKSDTTVTHRVVENRLVEGKFITKGDANDINDPEAVPYSALIGRVEHHFPFVGRFMMIYTSDVGKIYVLALALCGVMLNVLAGLIRSRRASRQSEEALLKEIQKQLEENKKARGDEE